MDTHERLLAVVGAQRSISGTGLLLLIGLAGWAIFLSGGSTTLLIQNIVVVGIPGLVLLYGGHWLGKTDLRSETYKYVAKWCNIGIAVMNGLLLLVVLIGGDPENIFQQLLMLTGIGGAAGFGIGVNQAKAFTKAREVEEQYEELKQERNMREQIFRASPVGISVINPDGSIKFTNDHLAQMSGRSKEEITSSDYNEPVFKARDEEGEPVEGNSVFEEALETGEPVYDKERQFETADGQKAWLMVNAAPITDDSGNITSVVVTMEDITDRKRREEQLELYEKIVESVKDGVYLMDENYCFTMVNDAYERMTGRSREELIGKPATDVVDEETAEKSKEKLQDLEPGESATLRAEMENPDGENIVGESRFMPMTDENGEVIGKLGIVRDITERQKLEEKLRKERNQSQKMTQSMIDAVENYAIFRLQPDGTVATWNKGAEKLKGYSKGEIVGEHFSKFYPEEDREKGVPGENLRKAEENGKTHSQGWRVRKDGSRFWADVTIQPIEEDGELTGFIKITEDVTERHRQEQEMERRLEEFSSLVSHDLKSPLNIAKGYLDLAENSKDEEDFRKVKGSLDNMSQIIEDMRIITLQPDDIQIQRLSLERAFMDSHQFVRTADSSHSIEDTRINASDSAIKRLLGNLIENSIEHNTEPVHIEAGPLEDREGFYYQDDGKGMSDDTKEKVLERGFTTTDGGRGLGLYIIRRVAELHDWDMDVKDAENGGARFEFYT